MTTAAPAIHPSAVVEAGAKLGAGVVVGPFCYIGNEVDIGDNTTFGPHCSVQGPARIGRDNRFVGHCAIGGEPQDKKYAGERVELVIGERNVFREFCTINRGTVHDKGVTSIGSDNLLMAYTHVAHDCVLGDKIVMSNCATLGGHVRLGDWVIMGGFSGVHQFCKVGAHAFIGNNAAVTRDVPPFLMIVGQPAQPHSVNSEGLKRRGFSEQQIRNLRNAYRVLYRSELKLEDALAKLQESAASHPEVKEFVDFIGISTRSLVR